MRRNPPRGENDFLDFQEATRRMKEHPEQARSIIMELRPRLSQRANVTQHLRLSAPQEVVFVEALAQVAPWALEDMIDAWHELNTAPARILHVTRQLGEKFPDVARVVMRKMRGWKGSEGRTALATLLSEGVRAAIGHGHTHLLDVALEQGVAGHGITFKRMLSEEETRDNQMHEASGNVVMLALFAMRDAIRKRRKYLHAEPQDIETTMDRGMQVLAKLHASGYSLDTSLFTLTPSRVSVAGANPMLVKDSGARIVTPMGLCAALHRPDLGRGSELCGATLVLVRDQIDQARLEDLCLDRDLMDTLTKSPLLNEYLRRRALLDHVQGAVSEGRKVPRRM